MTTSQTSLLSKPTSDERIPVGTLAYMAARNRVRLHEILLTALHNSGLSQASVASRLGKAPEVVNRLGSPGNCEIDSVSDYLFAITGAELAYSITSPLDDAARNDTRPDWLTETNSSSVYLRQKPLPPQSATSTTESSSVSVVLSSFQRAD
jgi:hypothetical protein